MKQKPTTVPSVSDALHKKFFLQQRAIELRALRSRLISAWRPHDGQEIANG